MKEAGPVRVDAVKSSINLASKYHFGGVSVRRDYLRVGFLSDNLIEDPQIVRVERLGPNRVGHSIRIRSPSDVNEDVVRWLKKAYVLQSR